MPKYVIERTALGVGLEHPFASIPRSEATARTAAVDARLRSIAAAAGAATIDPVELLCTPSHCPTADELGRPIYKDGSHLRASVARERFHAVDPYIYLR